MLNLGDSYTIGEAVEVNQRFPNQTVQLLQKDGIHFTDPFIIAKTGWTTDELANAITASNLTSKFDYVTLLIGVNNEFRGRDTGEYRLQFRSLLQTALNYASNNAKHVFVLSIPDWGATPFIVNDPKQRSAAQVAAEIDEFNAINKDEALKAGTNYIDITPISRQAPSNPALVASDGLHPSGLMYGEWVKLLAAGVKAHL